LGMYPAVKISVMGAAFVLNEAVKSALSFALVGRYVYIRRAMVKEKRKINWISKFVWRV